MSSAPTGRHIVEFIASRPEFVGVGKKTAQKLWNAYGTELYKMLAGGDPASMSDVLDWNRAAILIDAWQHQQSLADCVVFFDENGLDPRVARKAVKFWGTEAVAKIRDNPYRLLTLCPWALVDQCALRLGLDRQDPRRFVAAAEAVLYESLDKKNTWMSHGRLEAAVAKRLGVSRSEACEAVAQAVEDKAAVEIDSGYQPAGAAYMERFIEARVKLHLGQASKNDLFLDAITVGDIERFIADFSQSHTLTSEQVDAVRMALSNSFSLLVGGAGVGKTTALKAITSAARHFGMTVYQLAVAGRAANRMSEATGQKAQTIASWIQGVANGKIELGRHTFVIVDEASMLDLPTLFRILFHLPEAASVLLVGDTAQLPPIGFGLTLHRLVLEEAIPKTELSRILRSTEGTGIPSASRSIRVGTVPALTAYSRGTTGWSFVSAADAEIVHVMEDIRHDLIGQEVQIVAATYRGVAGIDAINSYFHNANPKRRPNSPCRFAPGDPCIWTVNDYDRGLWNGSLGRIVNEQDGVVSAEFGQQRYEVATAELDKLDLAYCISVHKAQGSQFGTVLVPAIQSMNFDRSMLYTAVTRAVERIVMVGSVGAVRHAVDAPPRSLDRDVGLRLRDADQ